MNQGPPAMKSLLEFVRHTDLKASQDAFAEYLVDGAKMTAVGWIDGNINQRTGGVMDVLTELVEPDNMMGGFSGLKQNSKEEWTATILIEKKKDIPSKLPLCAK